MAKLFNVETGRDKEFYFKKLEGLQSARVSQKNEKAFIGGVATLGIFLSCAVALLIASEDKLFITKYLLAGCAGYFTFEALRNFEQVAKLSEKSGLEIHYENIINVFNNRESKKNLEGIKAPKSEHEFGGRSQ